MDEVKDVPPIQRGVSSLASMLGSKASWSGKGYELPVKPLQDEGPSQPSAPLVGAGKDSGTDPADRLLTHRVQHS